LQSDQYIVNELYRFGGINSIRGFNENSLQGNFFSSLLTEYRYLISPELFVHSILDYGYYSDSTNSKSDHLFGFGFGFGLLTKNGLLNLIYANGSSGNQKIQLSNSVVHLSLKLNLF
jgi:hemolysin activation/secretion protein